MIEPPPRASRRRYAPDVLIIVGAVLIGALAAWMLVPYLSFPSSRLVGWQLAESLGGPGSDSTMAETTNVIPVLVDWPACAPVWSSGQSDDSWLGTPAITYTPWTVTITMNAKDSFSPTADCGGARYFSGLYVTVHLSEPLGGRALFDGSKLPPDARPSP